MSKRGGVFLCFIVCMGAQAIQAAPPLRIVGSSAVFPFAAVVAEHFHYKTQEPTPIVESIGTGAGIKLLCESQNGPDGAITSRPFTESEKKKCEQQGVQVQEFKIGQDGLVLIKRKGSQDFSLTLEDLRKAIAEDLPMDSLCKKNPNQTWNQIQPSFPAVPLHILGPAPASGTYDVLTEKIKEPCGSSLRHDGVYIEAPANENLIIQKVLNAPDAVGIITFSFYEKNKNHLLALPVEGITPSFSNIQEGIYPLSRPLYLYIKLNDLSYHANRALYVMEFTSPDAVGETGYLQKKGLIPLPEQKEIHERARRLLQVSSNDIFLKEILSPFRYAQGLRMTSLLYLNIKSCHPEEPRSGELRIWSKVLYQTRSLA
ncbi:MAG: substrate-binding domain-containing protein [Alphaproteobacteria bacterium]|nr:substrate-binding domain-containing protein [Alphaproteobacteria bacterium]